MKLILTSLHTYTLAKRAKRRSTGWTLIGVARAGRFRPVDLREIERIIKDNLDFLLRAWEKEQSKRANG